MSTDFTQKSTEHQWIAPQALGSIALVKGKADKNYVVRMKVTPDAKAVIERIREETDVPEVSLLSKIFLWFGQQPEELQRGILGFYGTHTPDIARKALERLAGEQGRHDPLERSPPVPGKPEAGGRRAPRPASRG